ncbi:MAG: zinc ribbon domain-containing protein [Lachnospiraceae bacterium]|nr:zinc ribbon domain-containing protein [Lachnospiraceae bacterium]
MKYCRKCGTLLEDTQVTCIRCGADVTLEENVSMYPIEVMETIEEENKNKKAKGRIVAMLIGLVAVLVGLVLFFLYGFDISNLQLPVSGLGSQEEDYEEFEEEEIEDEEIEDEEIEDEVEPEEEEDTETENRTVKDDNGVYYDYVSETDDAGNVVFTAIVPEDLTVREMYKDYEGYSDRYPFMLNYTASDEENDVRFTYLSPRKLWYKISETGKSRSNESDITHYMSYFKYDGPKSYLDQLLEQSYPGAKFEIKNEYDISEEAVTKLEELAEAKSQELFGDIGDYGHIGENTTYANMDHEFSAKVYQYEITLKDKNMLFCKYYVPSVAFNIMYANGDTNDRGTLTEWYNFAIVCFETGNEDVFDDYSDAFDVFAANALPTELFMYINESYSNDIKRAVESGEAVEPLDSSVLSRYGSAYSSSDTLDDFDSAVMDVLRSAGKQGVEGEDISVYLPEKYNIAFFDKEKKKVFMSPDEEEYPGESYEELM